MTINKKNDVIIIGTGLAGYMLAKEFRQKDSVASLTLITQSEGYFYSKPLLSTALTLHKTPDTLFIHDVSTMRQQLNATIITQSHVFKIDTEHKKIFFCDDKNEEKFLEYEKLILANGAQPIAIPLEGNAVHEIQHVNQFEDYAAFRQKIKNKKHIAILGAGLVGCELTNDLVNAGYQVNVIAPDHHPLSQWIPEAMGCALENSFSKQGVNFYKTVFPKKVNHSQTGYDIELSSGKTIYADLVLSAVGLQSDFSLAKTAHLTINKGIVVDRYLRTSDNHIFAVGDCAEVDGRLNRFVAAILHDARILSRVLTGENPVVTNEIYPVVIKTPSYPMVVLPPAKNSLGKWQIQSEGDDIQALFYDNEETLRGFALSGKKVIEKNQWLKIIKDDKG